jgi:hypothetical protein
MTERINVGSAITMEFASQEIRGELGFSALLMNVVRSHHVMDRGMWVVRSRDGIDGQ